MKSVDKPIVQKYNFAFREYVLPDHVHDRYIRCAICHIKYDYFDLKRVVAGQYVCKFCTLLKGQENV